MKFKFIGENHYPFDNKTETSFETDELSNVLMMFKDFLLGCGFAITGDIEITEPNDYLSIDKFDDEVNLAYGIYDKKFDMTNIPNNNWPFQNNPYFDTSEK
jgi:hypothetical protein